MKPKEWIHCPGAILEDFLWDLELDYDHYEGSKAETIHAILCNALSANDYNRGLIKGSWDKMSETEFTRRATNVKEHLERQLENVKAFLA